jgi:iron(III) transport system substrate-binding protein
MTSMCRVLAPRRAGAALVLATLALGVVPAAMGAEANVPFATVVANAEKEGRVVFLTTFPGSELSVPAAFQKAYPKIKVEAQRILSVDATPRLDQEAATNADGTDVALVSGEDWFIAKAAAGQLVVPVGPEAKRWQGTRYWKNTYIIGSVLPMVFGFNTSKTKPFTDWSGFMAPELAGKYGICDTAGPPVIAYNDWIQKTQPDGYLAKMLRDQKPVVFRSSSAAAQALAAGEIFAAQCMTPGAIEPLMKQGAPVTFVVPKPGFALVGGLGITGWAKRPNAAQVFMNWLMSDAGQGALMDGMGTAVSPVGVRATEALNIKSMHAWEAGQYNAAKYNELRSQFQKLISR